MCCLPVLLSRACRAPASPAAPAVDKFGRRFLFIEGGIQMAAAQVPPAPAAAAPCTCTCTCACQPRCTQAHQVCDHARRPALPRALQVVTGVVLGVEFSKHDNTLPNNVAIGVLVRAGEGTGAGRSGPDAHSPSFATSPAPPAGLHDYLGHTRPWPPPWLQIFICVFVAGFAWFWGERCRGRLAATGCALAWRCRRPPRAASRRLIARLGALLPPRAGPLGWLVPSEIQTLETRAAGMSGEA